MPTLSHCILTAKDLTVLEVLFDRKVNPDEFYQRLLHWKISTAVVVFQDSLDAQIATINSRVAFTVDGLGSDTRILVHAGADAYPGLSLPITTLRGLALLGMTAGERIVIERPSDQLETIRLDAVAYQPAAAARRNPLDRQPLSRTGCGVVSLASRRKAVAPFRPVVIVSAPEDDDPGPGPRAA